MTQCRYIPIVGEDPPCVVDAYYAKMQKDAEFDTRVAFWTIMTLITGIIVLVYIFA
jgi:hypothetical protein